MMTKRIHSYDSMCVNLSRMIPDREAIVSSSSKLSPLSRVGQWQRASKYQCQLLILTREMPEAQGRVTGC